MRARPEGPSVAIPEFDHNGNLPPGVYVATLAEIEARFTWNARRAELFRGLRQAIANLRAAGVAIVWVDGSFTTEKDEPDDVDGCWELAPSVEASKLDAAFFDRDDPRARLREKFGVDLLPAGLPIDAGGLTPERFFQKDRHGRAKGILLVPIGSNG